MLSRKRKIKRSLFSCLKNGKSFYSKNLSLRTYSCKEKTKNETKFSFVVSKKVSNSATARNLLKRRGYNSIKDIKNGFVCIFYFKKTATVLSSNDLNKEILGLLKEGGVLNK